jgi:hypothetical protein
MYRYKVVQDLPKSVIEVKLNLSSDRQEHLLTAVSALFYEFPKDATFDRPIEVYQDAKPVMEDQVEDTVQRLKNIFLKMEVMR